MATPRIAPGMTGLSALAYGGVMRRATKRQGYLIALFATIAVCVLRVSLNPWLEEQARLLPFVLAVITAAWWGGFGPGVFATVLGVGLGLLFIVPPWHSFAVHALSDGLNAVIFLINGLVVSLLCEALHAVHRRETEKQFRTLADSIPQLVWMAHADGARFWFNRGWLDYAGRSIEQLEGHGWQSLCDPAELPRVLRSYNQAIAAGKPWEDTYPLRRHDGALRWHLARAVPVRDEQGAITRWFGTSTDIQDRIEIERSLKEADARKDQFLATLAHELRNPLAPIVSALQLSQRVDDPAEFAHLRDVIGRQVRQLIRLIDDLLDVSRFTSGKIVLRRQSVELAEVIAAAVEGAHPLIEASEHKLSVSLPPTPIYVDADAARLTQVFTNLLNNAAKYTKPRGTISISAGRDRDRAVIRVRDNGVGIAPYMLAEIFKPFAQVDTSLDRAHGGLGIGLSLARQLIELHGGTIAAHSEGFDRGSEFVVVLPAVAAPPPVAAPAPATASPAEAPLECHRLLVVDDSRAGAETLTELLRSLGQDATALCDPTVAIEWMLSNLPEGAIIDIAMPGLDGYEVTRRVRAQPQLQHTFLIALTGYGQPEDKQRAFAAGFDWHLTKPASSEALRDLLRQLSRKETATASTS